MSFVVRSFIVPSRRVRQQQQDLAEQFQILLSGLLLASLGGYIFLSDRTGAWDRHWYLLASSAVVLLCFLLVRLGWVRLSSFLLLGSALFLTVWFQIERGLGTRLSYLSLVFVAIAWLLLGSRGGLSFAAAIAMTTLVLFGRAISVEGQVDYNLFIDVIGFLTTLSGLSAVLWLFARLLQRAYSRVMEQERRNQEYTVAQQIQQRLLPDELPQPDHGRLQAWCEPAQEISGDFYDVIRLSKGRLGIVIGDVCGKGLPAALLMNMARTTLRAEAQHSASASVTLSRVSATLAHDLSPTQFIALAYGVLDTRSGKLRLANAGQLEPILVRGRQLRYLATPGERLPLGLGVKRRYDELVVDLQPGDRLLFYTDGALEAQSSSGELYGFDRLEALLQRLNPGASAIARLQRELERFTNGVGAADDVTIVELNVLSTPR